MKPNAKIAKKHLLRIRQIVSKKKTPFSGVSEEEAIKKMRKVREELWEEKLAPRP
jgi:hypothetical protein